MKKIFKKSVAVFLTAMIMLSCWVWFAPAEASASANVPSDAVEYNGHWYKVYEICLTWENAKKYCDDLGGHLVTISSKEENDFVLSILKKSSKAANFIIGLAELKKEGEWSWVTGEPLNYTNWARLQPDNGAGSRSQNYGSMVNGATQYGFKAGQWDDIATASNSEGCHFICEWDVGGKKLPDGYDFHEDSYSFSNNRSANISKKYYSTLFEPSVADVVYKETHKAGALCYGFAYTTAAIYNGMPDVSRFSYLDGLEAKIATKIRDLDRETLLSMGSTVVVGGNYNDYLTLSDYIKYAYIYQYSQEAQNLFYASANDSLGLLNIVKEMTNNNRIGVVVGFSKKKDAPSSAPGGHEVLAVGYAGNEILIDNPNNTESFERLKINNDGSWSFGSYNSDHHVIDYAVNIHRPYQLLMTGERVTGWDSIINKDSSVSEGEYYVDGMEKLDSEYTLVRINSDSFELSSDDYLEISPSKSGLEESNNNKMFWIRDTNSVTISELSKDTLIDYAGDNTILSVDATKGSEVTMTINEDDITSEIKTKEGDPYVVSVKTITTDNDYINSDSVISVIATASSDTITATQTETGLLVTGISDGTVTLTKDDEVIATEEIKNAVGDIEITYDKEGESEDLDAEYHSHSYESSETKAATCKEKGELTYTCSCNDTYTEEIEINHDNHIGETEIRNVVNSTCTEKGYTGDSYCLDCGEKIAEGKATDIKGHKDADGNNSCDVCGETLKECSHMCHKTGFMGFIWKILRFFLKLFGSQPVCSCGVAHY